MLTKKKEVCELCDGEGYLIEVEAECCLNYTQYGCCGIPSPIQVQVPCKCYYE
jgi:hypothetical protein